MKNAQVKEVVVFLLLPVLKNCQIYAYCSSITPMLLRNGSKHSHANNTPTPKRTNRSHPTVPEQVVSNFVTLYPEHLAGFHTADKRSRTGVLVIVNSTRLCSAHALFTYTFKRQKRKTLK